MGATKKIAEWLVRSRWLIKKRNPCDTRFSFVRFGNVLGSSGSVLDIWERQLMEGHNPTITSRDMTRYFMTIPEAAAMVVRTSNMGEGGYVLDMGEPVKIVDLCRSFTHELKRVGMISRALRTRTIGARPGEKMHEVLVDDGRLVASGVKWIRRLELQSLCGEELVLATHWNRGENDTSKSATENTISRLLNECRELQEIS